MSPSTVFAAAVLGITAAFSAALPAYGQTVILIEPEVQAAPPEAPAEAQVQSSAYSEEELQKFAGAAITLRRINDDVVPKLEAAESRAEQQELAQAASMEMVQAVEGKGMSVDRFQEILWQAQNNPVVAQRVVQIIEDIQR